MSGVPKGGDGFQILPGSNTAGQIRFLLTRPHDFAAASPDLITASNSNLSDAELSMKRVSPSLYPENGVITGDLANSLSAVEAQEFIKDGLITTIPAGTEQVDIASFTKQATAKFNFTGLGLQNINQFSFARLNSDDDGPHTFNIGYASAYPSDQSGNYWQDASDIADALNNGVLKSTANQSLFDLGMRASGSGGNLTFTTASGNFVSSGIGAPEISTGGITNVASVTDALNASELQIFTREGRHIAGVAFSDAQITEFMTSANGFDDSAVYTAEYLNNTLHSYRGIDMDVSFAGGMHAMKVGSNEFIGPTLAQGTNLVPANTTLAQTVTVGVTPQLSSSLSIPIAVGASATAADSFNKILGNSGVRAEARTQIEFFDFQSTELFL